MKTIAKKILLFGLIVTGFTLHTEAQVQYNGCSVTGTYASAIGKSNTASGNNSFAGGYSSQATGSNSFAFGYNSKSTQSTSAALGNTALASGAGSMAIGNYVKATAQNAFVFGTGTTASYPLTNSTANSIAFGVNSNKPTMLITKSLNNNYTGKVAIGQVTTPAAKLHIKSDNNEDAGVILEPSNRNSWKAFIQLFDEDHTITVDKTEAMVFNAGKGSLSFQGNSYCFGDNALHISSTGKIGVNTVNNTPDFALAVDGGIISTKVHIKEVKQWPDHVFSADYQLLDLDDLKRYLDNNRHLPGVPSEQEILANGYDLNEMQYLMLEKIEEMTRYIILLQDEINQLKTAPITRNDSIVFTYDANGNRISRSLTFKKIISPARDRTAMMETDYELFPNPTSDAFTIVQKAQPNESSSHATLLTASGVIIETKELNGDKASFDLSGKPDGVYLLEIDSPEGRHAWRVIKQ